MKSVYTDGQPLLGPVIIGPHMPDQETGSRDGKSFVRFREPMLKANEVAILVSVGSPDSRSHWQIYAKGETVSAFVVVQFAQTPTEAQGYATAANLLREAGLLLEPFGEKVYVPCKGLIKKKLTPDWSLSS
jgi:hypothetical protein